MKKAVWIAYDFGLKGDYKSLYVWLDNHKAVECGNNIALVKYPYSNIISEDSPEFIDIVKKDFTENVSLSKSDRVYVIYRDSSNMKIKGSWISGNRRAAPWEGYGKIEDTPQVDEGE